MQPRQELVNACKGEQHTDHGNDGKPRHALALPLHADTLMQENRVEDPGDQRPGLLGIPAPPAGPSLLGLDGAGEDHHRQQQEAQADQAVDHVVRLHHAALLFGMALLHLKQVVHAQAAGDGKGRIGEGGRDNVQREPGGAQASVP